MVHKYNIVYIPKIWYIHFSLATQTYLIEESTSSSIGVYMKLIYYSQHNWSRTTNRSCQIINFYKLLVLIFVVQSRRKAKIIFPIHIIIFMKWRHSTSSSFLFLDIVSISVDILLETSKVSINVYICYFE